MPATSINHVSVNAQDLSTSVQFYRDVFGMEPLPTPNFGFPVQWLRVGALQLHVFERPGNAPVYHHLALTVDNFDAVYQAAKARGIHDQTTFGHHLYELPAGNIQMYLRDPGGNLIEVNRPDSTGISDGVLAEVRKLTDRLPQSDENLRATLFPTRGLISDTDR